MTMKGYRGAVGGSVQSAITDQPGVAVAGMLAFASDPRLVDSYFVNEALGVLAGRGVVASSFDASISLQRPALSIDLPDANTVASDFAGIVVFDEAMQSDENGNPGWEMGRMARVLRPIRVGGRIYVAAKDAIVATNPVYLVKAADAGLVFEAGDFTDAPVDAALTGVGAAVAGNTGAGTITAAPVIPALTPAGVYTARCTLAAEDGGTFEYFDPNGLSIGTALVGVAFAPLGTTIADGDPDFIVGDEFTVTVTDAAVTVLLPNASWVQGAAAGGVAMIEFV